MQYLISRQGQTYGPYAAEDVKRMLAERRILPSDLCWTEGMAGWEPVSRVFGPAASPPGPAAAGNEPPRSAQGSAPQGQPVSAPWPGPGLPGAAGALRGGAPAWPVPPDLHWVAVLLIHYVTCGVFGIIWMFVQANFVKKIHPGSPARVLLFAYLGFMAALIPLTALMILVEQWKEASAVIIAFLALLGSALCIWAIFSMRRSLLYHYNTAENIGLRLNPVLTFFFNILYFQYHFSRIARWRNTGVLA